MTINLFVKSGDTLPAVITSLSDATGSPIDLTTALSVTFSMALEGSADLTVASASAEFVGARTTGVVQYPWGAGDTDVPGLYEAAFTVTWPGGNQTFPSEGAISVLIQPNVGAGETSTAPSFVTTADVKRITGRDVEASVLSLAWSVLEAIIGRPAYELLANEYDNVLTARDQYWLTKAVAFEAAWIVANPDTFESLDVSTINQSGQGGTLNVDALIVAPMARRCLRWCTWTKTRSVRMQRPLRNRYGANWSNGNGDYEGPAWISVR